MVKAKEAVLVEVETEVATLCQYVIYEHINGFQKALREVEFIYKKVPTSDACFSVNLDIYDGHMIDVEEITVVNISFL
ncbi:MAG: hypothetical protein Q8778_02610 [Sweet potato little leaf phytoplasma]|nr:hypothetical protein [Sweet potato little leaf phytoplasma]